MATKITTLTGSNIAALEQAQREVGLDVTTTATTATFPGTPAEAWKAVDVAGGQLGNKYGRRGHPVASIHAVLRKALATEPERGNVTTTEHSDSNQEGAEDMTATKTPAKKTPAKRAPAKATKPAAKTAPAKKAPAKKAPAKAATPKTTPAKATAPAKGVAWLVEQIETKNKLVVTQKTARDAIRYLVRNDQIKDADIRDAATGRYAFRGITDANVKAIIAKVKDIVEEKAKPKAAPAKKAPAKKAPAKSARKAPATKPAAKTAPADDLDLDDDATEAVLTDDDSVFNDDELDLD